MRITVENPAEWIAKLLPTLMRANAEETGFGFELAPDVDAYQRMYELGIVFGVLARDGDKPVGYCTVVVTSHAHNPAIVTASNDALFVDKAYRKGLTAGRLIKAVEREAKERGAVRMTWHCRAGTPLAEVMQAHGYEPADIVVMKEI
ncbi:MAG TPA: GNAT family N-acetyltransferase [Burkholderiaceae bacterium]